MPEEAANTRPGKPKPVKHVVLDTGVIIANVNLHNIADHYYAPPEVVAELRSSKAITTFETLPFEVVIRDPSHASMKAVIDASKKTGDYQSLSIPDMKVIALTYDLAREFNKKDEDTVEHSEESMEEIAQLLDDKVSMEEKDTAAEAKSETQQPDDANCKGDVLEGFCEDASSDDEEGWITEDNIVDALKKMGAFEVEEGLVVACLTTDFALQNVLLSMDLGLVSISGYRIKKLKSFVLRCRACYKTTSNMEKQFCPECGNKMLHKCAISVNENGEQILHVNWKRQHVKRGLKHSVAGFKGGKHAVNEQLFEDQRMPQNLMAKLRQDPLADGPFSMHDTTSRSAMLGVRTMNNRGKGRRNPNESKGNRRK